MPTPNSPSSPSSPHGQGEQERLGPDRDPGAQQGQDPDREGGVGGHGDGPAPRRRAAGVDGQEDQGRDQRPSQCGDNGEGCSAGLAQPADGEFAFDLQPDDQEEDGHQGVVDPVPQIPAQAPHRERLLPEALVGVGQGAVGQGESGDGGGQQDRSADGFDAQELHDGVQDAAGPASKRHRGLLWDAGQPGSYGPSAGRRPRSTRASRWPHLLRLGSLSHNQDGRAQPALAGAGSRWHRHGQLPGRRRP
jgi:hypothetical protein